MKANWYIQWTAFITIQWRRLFYFKFRFFTRFFQLTTFFCFNVYVYCVSILFESLVKSKLKSKFVIIVFIYDCIYLKPELMRYPCIEIIAGLGYFNSRCFPSSDTVGYLLQSLISSSYLNNSLDIKQLDIFFRAWYPALI